MRTILVCLNEINMEYVRKYSQQGLLPAFDSLLKSNKLILTTSENEYALIEPWIQWVTVHTGLSYDQHKVKRLGDIVKNHKLSQIFEELEEKGLLVGAVSPFNAENRMKKPAFFMPDPWTTTAASGNYVFCKLYEAIKYFVNENSNRNKSGLSALHLLIGLFVYASKKSTFSYLKLILNKGKPGSKARILDKLIFDVFIKEFTKHQPDFSTVFLNSGAHIQHHYLFNSTQYVGNESNPEWYCKGDHDPLINILTDYDKALGRILKFQDINLVVATGLHQVPHEKTTYYWRPKNHTDFLRRLKIDNFVTVNPRMSRDFLIEFKNVEESASAAKLLSQYIVPGFHEKAFAVDNRGKSLFVEFVHSGLIDTSTELYNTETRDTVDSLNELVSFVAIKNGEHNGTGYLMSNRKLQLNSPIPLKDMKSILMNMAIQKNVS